MYKDRYFFATNDVPDPEFAKLKNFDLNDCAGRLPGPPLKLVLGDINNREQDEMYPWDHAPPAKNSTLAARSRTAGCLSSPTGPSPGRSANGRPCWCFEAGFHRAAVAGNGLTMYLQGPLADRPHRHLPQQAAPRSGVTTGSKPEAVTAPNHPDSKKGDMQPS